MTPLAAYELAIETRARTEPCPQCKTAVGKTCKPHSEFACLGRVRLAYAGRSDAPEFLKVVAA